MRCHFLKAFFCFVLHFLWPTGASVPHLPSSSSSPSSQHFWKMTQFLKKKLKKESSSTLSLSSQHFFSTFAGFDSGRVTERDVERRWTSPLVPNLLGVLPLGEVTCFDRDDLSKMNLLYPEVWTYCLHFAIKQTPIFISTFPDYDQRISMRWTCCTEITR